MGKSRDLFKKIRDTKGIFHAKMGTIKYRNDSNSQLLLRVDSSGNNPGDFTHTHTHIQTHTHTHILFIILNVEQAFSILLLSLFFFSLADNTRKWLGTWIRGSGRPGCNSQVQSFASRVTLGNVYNLSENPSEKGWGFPGVSVLKNLSAMQEPQKMQV